MNLAEEIKISKAKIATLEFNLAVEKAVFARLSVIGNTDQTTTSDEQRSIIPGSIVPYIRTILINKGKPMKVAQLAKAIKLQGIHIKGKTQPKRLISSALVRRNDLFERVERGLYQLKAKKETAEINAE